MAGRGSPPGVKYGGRPKGGQNKMTVEIREMILGALSDVGGQRYLAEQAMASPAAFMSLLAKTVPAQLRVGDSNGQPLLPPIINLGFGNGAPGNLTAIAQVADDSSAKST